MPIIISKKNGGVAVMRLAGEARADAELAKWMALHPGEYAAHHQVSEDGIPGDRTFRDAWTLGSPRTEIAIDMARAQDIWREKIREARRPILQRLDIAYQRADEAGDGDAKAAIMASKQALRDGPADPGITRATTPEALKAVWPVRDEAAST